MSADGTWKLSMQTPIGERKSTLALKSAGGTVTGKLTADEGASTDIFDGKASGDKVTFKAAIKSPMALTLEFTASVAGDKISGNVTASGVGTGRSRAPEARARNRADHLKRLISLCKPRQRPSRPGWVAAACIILAWVWQRRSWRERASRRERRVLARAPLHCCPA